MSRIDEIYSSAPIDDRYFTTVEFIHSAFRDENDQPTSYKLVQGYEALTATLESNAPLDADATVDFIPVPFEITLPKRDVSGRQDMRITIDAVSVEITKQLELQAVANREPIKLIWRVYVESDLSEPADTLIMTLKDPQVTSTRMTGTAVFTDVINKAFPSINYTLSTHPGLA